MTSARKKQLKTLAHSLKPVLIVGQSGLTESVLKELEITLNTHELMKVKIRAERNERTKICDQIIIKTEAEPIQQIGQIIVIYRKKPEK